MHLDCFAFISNVAEMSPAGQTPILQNKLINVLKWQYL